MTFIRRDLALAAIRQNPGQFEKRYEKYAMRWTTEEALRLAAWVCHRGKSLPRVSGDDVRTAPETELSRLMSTIWGEKMGGANSKEARSEVWFFAALSDFRSQIQAQDIVAFLAEAAKESVRADPRWSDRILAPTAMRNALPKCSEQKIEAIGLENPPCRSCWTGYETFPSIRNGCRSGWNPSISAARRRGCWTRTGSCSGKVTSTGSRRSSGTDWAFPYRADRE